MAAMNVNMRHRPRHGFFAATVGQEVQRVQLSIAGREQFWKRLTGSFELISGAEKIIYKDDCMALEVLIPCDFQRHESRSIHPKHLSNLAAEAVARIRRSRFFARYGRKVYLVLNILICRTGQSGAGSPHLVQHFSVGRPKHRIGRSVGYADEVIKQRTRCKDILRCFKIVQPRSRANLL